jgi:hypothetical protein
MGRRSSLEVRGGVRERGRGRFRKDRRGVGLVEIALTLVVAAIVGAVAYAYFASTAKTLEQVREERPMSQARLAADRATVIAIRSSLQMYYGQNGQWPPTKEAVSALMSPPPAFQCTGNDFAYDPATGEVRLLSDDVGRC